MRECTSISLVLVLLILTAGCKNTEWLYPKADPDRNMVIFYGAAHTNGLSTPLTADIDELRNGYLPDTDDKSNILVVYYHLSDNMPRLSRFSKDSNGELREEVLVNYSNSVLLPTYSLEDISISQVIKDAETLYPSKRHSLIFSTHGSGFFPANYHHPKSSAGESFAIGPDDNLEIDIIAFSDLLSEYHFDTIVYDCCFMGCVEASYELADCCDYVVSSPAETMTAGITSEFIIEPLFNMDPENAAREICKGYMNLVRTDSKYSNSGTISLVKTSELKELATICRQIFLKYGSKAETMDVSAVQPYHRSNSYWFFDFDDFIKNLLTDEEGVIDSQYDEFHAALSKVVIFKDATPKFLNLTIDSTKYSGLSTYIPRRSYTDLNAFYAKTAWNKAVSLIY